MVWIMTAPRPSQNAPGPVTASDPQIIIDNAPIGIFMSTPGGRYISANPALARMYGYDSPAELIASITDISTQVYANPEDRKAFMQFLEEHDEVLNHECRFRRRDGSEFWISMNVQAVRDEQGQIVAYQGFNTDITARKQAEQALLSSHNVFDDILESTLSGYWDFHFQTNAGYYSPAFTRMFGYETHELPSTLDAWKGLILAEDLPGVLETFDRHVRSQGREPFSCEVRYRHRDGSIIWVICAGRIIVWAPDRTPLRMVGCHLNITERKRAQEAFVLAKEAAEAASRAKSELLVNMSHEIRTPLNAVLGFAGILQRDASLGPEQVEHAKRISSSGEHLLALINNILDMSRIEAGWTELLATEFCLSELMGEMESTFRPQALAKGLHFRMDPDRDLPPCVQADQGKLRQILLNLLSNAVKFTAAGQVVLRVRCAAPKPGEVQRDWRLTVEVEDSGPGIPAKDLERLFAPFFQTAMGHEVGGFGLGLSISRNLARIMGGDLTVLSREGQGSCFRLEISIEVLSNCQEQSARVPQTIALEPGAEPRRVLVVDDKADNLALLASLLQSMGFAVREAINGAEALDIFQGWQPHAVLLDMRMPVMDGYEAARRIKATEAGGKTFVVAVTAGVSEDCRNRIMAAGVDACLTKPIRAEDLHAVLARGLGLRLVGAEGQASPAAHDVVALESSAPQPRISGKSALALRQAATSGDIVLLTELINALQAEDAHAARSLRGMAEHFDYKRIIAWLQDA